MTNNKGKLYYTKHKWQIIMAPYITQNTKHKWQIIIAPYITQNTNDK